MEELTDSAATLKVQATRVPLEFAEAISKSHCLISVHWPGCIVDILYAHDPTGPHELGANLPLHFLTVSIARDFGVPMWPA